MIYMGIDPGQKGGYAMIDGEWVTVKPWDDLNFARDVRQLSGKRVLAAVEKVGAMPGQGVTSMFSFGTSYGFIQGVLTAFEVAYQLVPPRKWKAEFGLLNTEKQASVDVARRLFPGVSLRPTGRCRKDSDGMSDALLLMEYARRKL
jgi:crossover junction endodeoxyribonuclease RuvC